MLGNHEHQDQGTVRRIWRIVGCACRAVGRQRRPQQTLVEEGALGPFRLFPPARNFWTASTPATAIRSRRHRRISLPSD